MSFPRYLKYKDSGAAWLGQVPAHWEVVKVTRAIEVIGSGTTPQSDALEYYEAGDVPWINTGDLNDGRLACPSRFVTAKALANYTSLKVYPAGSLVMAMYGATIGRLALTASAACVNQACCVFAGESKIDLRFMFYWLLSMRPQILSLATGGGQPNVSQDVLRSLRVAFPLKSEQAAIVQVLEQETAKIDALVAEQQRLVELLKEKRQAVISHAVTKGLNHDAPMKASGIEWLGDVPAHWEVMRLKRVSPHITVGIVVEPSKFYVPEGVPALRSLNILPGRIRMDGLVFISAEANRLHEKSQIRTGDLVAVRSGQPGTCAVVPEELDGCNCIDLIIIRRPLECTSDYLCWYLASDAAVSQFAMGSGGAIQQHFNVATASEMVVPVPPRSEQEAILGHVNGAAATVDTLIAEAERAIALLQERRTALSFAAITGQIDVCGLVATEVA